MNHELNSIDKNFANLDCCSEIGPFQADSDQKDASLLLYKPSGNVGRPENTILRLLSAQKKVNRMNCTILLDLILYKKTN